MTRAKLTLHRGWQDRMFRTTAAKQLVTAHTLDLQKTAITEAPRRGHSPLSWNSIKNNIEAFVANDLQGWHGNIVVDRNPRVRHTMLTDRGASNKGLGTARRPESRRFLKRALLKMRVE